MKMPRVAGSTILSGGRVRGFPFGRIEIVTCLWTVYALATLAASQHHNPLYPHERYGKRVKFCPQPLTFLLGSRYGRTGTTDRESKLESRESKMEPKKLVVSPRVDPFFVGSRYGKRSLSDDNDNLQTIIKQYANALEYFNRGESADRIARTMDNVPNEKSNDKIDRNNGNNEEIPNEDELENFW